ncbi:MAG: YSC84-related protein [Syntrophobacteraceae bacterium]
MLAMTQNGKETQAVRKAGETRTTMKWTILTALVLAAVLVLTQGNGVARAASAAGIDADVDAALMKLYEEQPVTKMLAQKAVAILVFPNMVKAGFLVGAQYGEGALLKKGRTVGYYNSVAASYGLQAGAQTFGYVLFLMTNSAVHYLNQSAGWEIGAGPGIVVADEGIARTLTSTTLKADVYAFIFDQKGLMAGIGLQGSKITKINK